MMRIVGVAILWGLGGGVFGLINGVVISWALGWPIIETALVIAVGVGLVSLLYYVLTPYRWRTALQKSQPQPKRKRKSSYRSGSCAWCKGTGMEGKKKRQKPCTVCDGQGQVLVNQPPQTCHKCKGKGRLSLGRKCDNCYGAGWEIYGHLDDNLSL